MKTTSLTTMRLRANRRIMERLEKALRAARLTNCAVEKSAQDAMKLYLDTWVVGPLDQAIEEMKR